MPRFDAVRVAYVCADPGVPVFGRKGCSVHVQEVLRALVRRGAEVDLFAMRFDGPAPADLASVRIHPLPPVPRGDLAAREQALLAANSDVRHALEGAGTFDVVYERYSLWSYAGLEYARRHGTPGLLEVNAPLIEEQAEYRGLIDRASAECVADRVFGVASALVAVSDDVAAYLSRQLSSPGRIHVIPNGVDPNRFAPALRPTCPAAPGTFTIGFVGSLKPWHGLSVLVDAFARVGRHQPNLRLLVVGDGPARTAVEQDLSERGLAESAMLTGAVPPDEIPGLLASMDGAVAPYPRLEHFYFSPLKLYEYMAAGLPVIASAVGQIEELIEDGVNGLLCAPGDPVALASAIDRLCQDPGLRARLGQSARETICRGHTWDTVVARILAAANLEPHGAGRNSDPTAVDFAGRGSLATMEI